VYSKSPMSLSTLDMAGDDWAVWKESVLVLSGVVLDVGAGSSEVVDDEGDGT